VPKIEPAERLIRMKSILSKIASFKEITKMPIKDARLIMTVATIAFIKLDKRDTYCFHFNDD
jgi:hypothetical protein